MGDATTGQIKDTFTSLRLQDRRPMEAAPKTVSPELVRIEETRLFMADMGTKVLASILGALCVLIGTWPYTSWPLRIGWSLAITAVYFGAWMSAVSFNRSSQTYPESLRARRHSTWLASIGGFAWCSLPVLAWPQFDAYMHLTAVLAMTLVALSSVGFAFAILPVLYLFSGTILIPLATVLFFSNDPNGKVEAFGLLIVWAMIMTGGRQINHLSRRGITLAFEKEALVEQLQASHRARTRFFAAANHDLRQPIHALGLMVGALREHVEGVGQLALARVQASIETMSAFLDALLEESQLESGVVTQHVGVFPLQRVLAKIQADFEVESRAKGITLRTFPTQAQVVSDPVLLERILRNLVGNAVRYTKKGRVVLGCRRRGSNLRIEIRDQGPGIPAEQLSRIFEEFVRGADAESGSIEGWGLGLSIARRYAHLLGHELGVRSQVGKGSVFTVTVPLARSEIAPLTDKREDAAEEAPLENNVAGSFVLVVDDDDNTRIGMSALLKRMGCHVLTAGSGNEAISGLREHLRSPDLIITDFNLGTPESGLDVLRSVWTEVGERVPSVIVTGSQTSALRTIAADERIPVILKPVGERRLRELLVREIQREEGSAGPR